MPIQWFIWGLLLLLAAALTQVFNRTDSPLKRGAKFLGVVVSTVPIIGLAQGLAFRTKDKGYSEACFYQAAAGMVAYLVMKYVVRVVG